MKNVINPSINRRELLKLKAGLLTKIKLAFFFATFISFSAGLFAQTRTVSGIVKDVNGEVLPGVTISIQGTTTGTISGVDGKYELPVTGERNTLVFSFVGMVTQEIQVTSETTVDVVLKDEVSILEEVVVVGYGTQKKANLTGSVSTVTAEVMESRPVTNVSQALQGVIPGLNLQTQGLGGQLNTPLSVNVRGAGTIGSGSTGSPLVLIDGMEGDMNILNPQDIESITVLKDAASASIYGSRAPFGVILITTKQGKAGRTVVNYNTNLRWTSPLNMPEMMDSHTFALYWNEAAANDGEGAKFSQEVLDRIVQYQNGEIDYSTVPTNDGSKWQMYSGSNANTDWFKEQYKSSAFSQEHALSISGGHEKTQYHLSGNFMDQSGLARHAGDELTRYSLAARINTQLSDYVSFNYSTRFVRQDYSRATHMTDLFYHNIARRWPTVPAQDPNGIWTDASEIAQLREGGSTTDQEDKLYLQGQLVITPIKGWNIFAEGNARIDNYHYNSHVLPAYAGYVDGTPLPVAVGWNAAGHTSVYEYNRKNNYYSSNIYSNYEFNLNDAHYFKVLAGFNSELMKYRTLAGSRTNLITPTLPTINTATDDSKADEGQYQHWATAGFFGRLNYAYKDRYLLEVNARYDGTSRFIDDKRWNVFPSVSVGWNVAKEEFWAYDHIMQMLKFRGSFGELGNQNTSNWYPFYSSMPVSVNSGSWLINGQKPTTSSAPGLVSSLLTWERVRTWNIGVDMAMLNNRLGVNFDYFKRYTFDMVGPAPELPVTLGTGVPQINNADMESYGFELEASWRDQIGEFRYSVRGVLSDDQQKVTSYPNPTGNIGQWYNGRKFGEIWGLTTIGIAQSQEQMDAHLATVSQSAISNKWGAGDIMYADINGDGRIDYGSSTLGDTGDRKIIGNSSPRYRFSLDLSGEYKNFDLRLFFQGVGKRDYMPNGPYFWGANGGMWQSAGFNTHMDYYRDENSVMVQAGKAGVNQDAYFPKPYFNTGKNKETQTRYLQNAAYVRLKNIQIGYTIPNSISSRIGISKARFYVSGENLLTITDLIKTFDPETIALSGWNDGKTYPLAKVISCGVSVNF